ncbi:MAG: hypothetical protein KDA83_21225, partial [Planctomycetales bacterium]|nr:hypothetical protein [Planctomycetales bacterium]
MPIREIIQQILHGANLTRPDGRPLFAYPVPTELGEALRAAVASRLHFQNPDATLCAGFCFSAAGWLGQLEDRAATWDRLWQECFDLDDAPFVPAKREPMITKGLQYWRRTVIRLNNNRYLSTLIVEGGLAAKLMAEPGNPLHSYVLDVLNDHEQFPRIPIEEIARQYDGRLARAYRNRTVHTLVAGFAQAIAAARRLLASMSANVEDPLNALDESWRAFLPLSLADEAAQQLVRQLMTTPPVASPTDGFELSTLLTEDSRSNENVTTYRITRRLRSPNALPGRSLVQLLPEGTRLPKRAEVVLHNASQQVVSANLLKRAGIDHYRIESTDKELSGADAIDEVCVSFVQAGQPITELKLAGGRPLPD